MKNIIIFILLVLFSIQSFSQVQILMQKCFGGTSSDYNYSAVKTNNGGFILTGVTWSSDGDVIGYHGAGDIWVVKMDSSGIIQWNKCFGGSGTEYSYSIIQTSDSNFIITGYTTSVDGDITYNHGGLDIWILKIDILGNLIWQKTYGGTNDDYANSIIKSNNSEFVVCGKTKSNNGDVTINISGQDLWVLYIDSIGNIQWQKTYNYGNSSAKKILKTNDNGYVLFGSSYWDFILIKIDSLGNFSWQKTFGGTDLEQANSIINTSDGGFLLIGDALSNNGNVFGNHGGQDIWVVKTDSLGNLIWQRCYGGTGGDNGFDAVETEHGTCIIVGTASSVNGDLNYNNGGYDCFFYKIDSLGNIIWKRVFWGSGFDWPVSICKTDGRNFIISGYTDSNDNDIYGNHGSDDFLVLKFIEPNISGHVFHDINFNGIKDTGEQGVAGHLIKLEPGPFYTVTNNEGNYYFSADTGQHTVTYISQAYWVTTNTPNYNVYVDSVTQVIDTLDFGVISKINMPDVAVYIIGSSTSTNRVPHYWLTYKNWGTTTASGTINFTYDPILIYNNSTQTPASQTGNTIVWNYDTLGPGAQRIIRADFDIPGIQYLGDTIYSNAWISPITPDSNITNNYDTLRQIITGPVDPNDKIVTPEGLGGQGYILHGQKLNYTINFQNTGNDTAITVVIRDTINSFMNIETFSVDASSHPVTWELLNNHEIVFHFQNILLPDSNVNEPLSHGFVRYSLSPNTGLSDFSEVHNTSYIFFDYNPAVITNTTTNTYVSSLTSNIQINTNNQIVKAYPNPSPDRFLINLPEFTNKVQVFNIQGELLQSFTPEKPVAEINLKGQPAGVYLVKMQTFKGAVSVKVIKE